jgi:hypothetical protein
MCGTPNPATFPNRIVSIRHASIKSKLFLFFIDGMPDFNKMHLRQWLRLFQYNKYKNMYDNKILFILTNKSISS